MTERNQFGYKTPTETEALRNIQREADWRAYKQANPLPRHGNTMDEDALFEADRNRPMNRYIQATEAQEQKALMEWTEWVRGKYPELSMLFHIPNERKDEKEAAFLKTQGVKSGVPDLFLPVARCGYHGLFIELKSKSGRLMETQKTWLRKLNRNGYLAVICRGSEDAQEVIEGYLNESLDRV